MIDLVRMSGVGGNHHENRLALVVLSVVHHCVRCLRGAQVIAWIDSYFRLRDIAKGLMMPSVPWYELNASLRRRISAHIQRLEYPLVFTTPRKRLDFRSMK